MKRQIDLELIKCKRFKSGTVQLMYRVKHPSGRDTRRDRRRVRRQ
jgi:hypothetical protein